MIGGTGIELLLRLKADADQAVREFRRVGDEQNKMSAGAKAAVGVAATAFAGLAVGGLREIADFDTGMREVFTLMPGMSQDAMEQMRGQVQQFGSEFGLLTDEVVPALYQAISAGVPPDNVMDFMRVAAQTARGGATDMETAVDGLTSAVNAYGSTVLSAQDAADIMFTGVRLGKTTIGELSESMFQVVPVAAAAGVSFDQVVAALAAMTASGVPTTVASTNLRGALVELGKQGSVAFDMFAEAAGETFPEFIEGGGDLNEAFDLLAEHAEDSGTDVQNMFGSVEAGMAATVLATEQGSQRFGDYLGQMGDRAGAAEGAFGTMAEGIGFTFDQLKAKAETMMLGVGEALLPIVEALIPVADSLLPALSAIITPLAEGLVPVVEALAPLLEGLGPLMETVGEAMGTAAPLIADAVGALTPMLEVVTGMVGALNDLLAALQGFNNTAEETDPKIAAANDQLQIMARAIMAEDVPALEAAMIALGELGFSGDEIHAYWWEAAQMAETLARAENQLAWNSLYVGGSMDSAADSAQKMYDRLRALTGQEWGVRTSFTGIGPTSNPLIERRQHGGPVYPGRPYIVGEDGPELMYLAGNSGFVSSSKGFVSAAKGAVPMPPVMLTSSQTVVAPQIIVQGQVWALDDLAAEVEARLVRAAARGGTSLVLGGAY